jgi:hypothetical protein
MCSRLRHPAVVLLLLATAVTSTADAGILVPAPETEQGQVEDRGPVGFLIGVNGAYGSPQGEFRRYVKSGLGVVVHGTVVFGPARAFGIRLELGDFEYGRRTVERPFSSTTGEVTVDVTTSNTFALLGAGPYVMLPVGRVRPYAYATAGLAYFETRSSVESQECCSSEPIAESKNYGDGTHALVSGGGLAILVSRGRTPIAVDIGVQYRWQGRTRYLREGSIQQDSTGAISFTPIESRTNLFAVWVGVSASVR